MDDSPEGPDIASVAALVGDPARARMLTALMDGRALTATELALEAGVAPSTASSHLARLARARLVTAARQGRHRYFRLAGSDVAAALEGLMAIAPRSDGRRAPRGPADDGLRRARLCYDHLAGQVAVRLLADLRDRGWLHGRGDVLTLTRDGGEWFRRALGLDPDALCRRRRPLCRPCLDWSERRLHLAGALGAALLDRLLALRYVRLETGSRAVVLLPRGIAFFDSLHPAGPDGALRGREVRPPRPARRRGFSVE